MQVSESQYFTSNPILWGLRVTLCAVLAVFISGLTPTMQTNAYAQDDPFALDSDPDAAVAQENAPVLADIDQITDETTKLVLRTVRDSKLRTPEKLAKAAQVMMDIKLDGDARYYLGLIAMMGLDDNQLFELHEVLGSDFFSLIQASDAVQPEGKTLSRMVLAAATKVGLSPARIDELIKVLNNSDITVRSDAFRKLRRLGEPAVAELLNVFAQDDRVSDFPGVRGALNGMGAHAQGPLLGAARASDIQVQTEAIRSLGYNRTAEALDVIMRAYLSPKAPEFLRTDCLGFTDPCELSRRSSCD